MRRAKGFTLIELLVVIAIMGLLIAILVSTLKKLRQRAKNVQCTTNLRSTTQAFNIYLYDIDGQQNLTDFFLTLGIIPNKLLICPQTEIVRTSGSQYIGSSFETWGWQDYPKPQYTYGSYGANFYWTRPPLKAEKGFVFNRSIYNRMMPLNESIIPAFVDAVTPEVGPDEANSIPIKQLYTPASQLAAMAMRRHGSTTNVAYADAHVEAVKLENLWTLKWKSNWKRMEPFPVPADWKYIPQQP